MTPCLLDLLVVFDMVDHFILLEWLEKTFSFTDLTIKWLDSHIENWIFQVYFATHFSSPVMLMYGVLQGSVLSPLLFIIYTAELEDVMKRHVCNLHTYADDNQVYVHCRYSDCVTAVAKFVECVKEVDSGMAKNQLKLNPSKTEFMWFGTTYGLEKLLLAMTNINFVVINPVKSAKNLGVTIDDDKGLLTCASAYQLNQRWCVLNGAACLLLHIPRFDRDLRIKVKTNFIGCVCRSKSSTSCAHLFTSHCIVWLQDTLHPCHQGLVPLKSPVSRQECVTGPKAYNFNIWAVIIQHCKSIGLDFSPTTSKGW